MEARPPPPATARGAAPGEARPGEALARFFEARGHRVFEAAGAFWVPVGRHLFRSVPNQLELACPPAEIAAGLRRARVLAARYFARGRGRPSGIFACDPATWSLERLDATHRKHVRRGLSRCELRPMGADELADRGLELNLDTMARQQRFDPEFGDPARWRRLAAATGTSPGVSVTGAFVDGRLAAYLVACRDGAWIHALYKMSRTADLPHHANVALDFHLVREAAKDASVERVGFGRESVTGPDGVSAYKRAMGIELVPRSLAVQLHPALAPFVAGRGARLAARAVARLQPRFAALPLLLAAVG